VKPTDVAALRRQLIDWLGDQDATRFYELYNPGKGAPDAIVEQTQRLTAADCFYVNAEMTAVARHAGATMPDQKPLANPGFIIWDGPLTDHDVDQDLLTGGEDDDHFALLSHSQALSWELTTAERDDGQHVPGAHLTFWSHHPARTRPPMIPIWSAFWDFTLPIRESAETDNQGDYAPVGRWIGQFNMTAHATMVLMGQTVAQLERVLPDRAERRRAARAGANLNEFTVVQLRRRTPVNHPDEGQAEAVNWSRRWMVSGHWRRQWYPSLQDHRAVWVHGYVKGPEDKPLVLGDKVKALLR
jgi:hypothetical protein